MMETGGIVVKGARMIQSPVEMCGNVLEQKKNNFIIL